LVPSIWFTLYCSQAIRRQWPLQNCQIHNGCSAVHPNAGTCIPLGALHVPLPGEKGKEDDVRDGLSGGGQTASVAERAPPCMGSWYSLTLSVSIVVHRHQQLRNAGFALERARSTTRSDPTTANRSRINIYNYQRLYTPSRVSKRASRPYRESLGPTYLPSSTVQH